MPTPEEPPTRHSTEDADAFPLSRYGPVAVPLELLLAKAPPFAYHVCVHAFDIPDTFAVYTIRLADRLPSVAIPLLPGDGSVTVDLQAVFRRCYDTGPYRRRVRYDPERIEPPLTAEQTEWARGLLRSQNPPLASEPGQPPPGG